MMVRVLPDPDGKQFHIVADDAGDTVIVHINSMVRLREEIDRVLAMRETA
jgi:hypothetical protein